jgi:hypothetical protein
MFMENNCNMFATIKLLSFMVGVSIIYSCSKSVYPTAWENTPVVADGILNEWSVPLQYYDENTKLNYDITNDQKNLYVSIRSNDEQIQTKMLRGGFTLWIDVTGKKKQITGITYPLKTKEGIQVAMKYDSSGALAYEAIIPFSTFGKNNFSPSDTIKPVNIGMVVNGIELPAGRGPGKGYSGGEEQKEDSYDGGEIGGGHGGSGMGGMHGMGGRGRGGNHNHSEGQENANESMSETNSGWTLIKLSYKNQQ